MSTDPLPPSPTPRRGGLTQALGRMFMKEAVVADAKDVGGGFHVIDLESPQFRAVTWSPGQKVQIAVAPPFTYRTYTPIEWDGGRGRTRIIAYAHGAGPGSDWARQTRAGDTCEVFGPRASLSVGGVARPALLFGDETSFGVAAALQQHAADGALRCVFEVNSADTIRSVLDLDSFGISNAVLLDRTPADAHLEAIEGLGLAAAQGMTFILTGKATSIQRVRAMLKRHGVPGTRMLTKAYWSPGKKGLD